MKRWWVLKGLKMLVLLAVVVGGGAYVVMSLWNFVLPAATGLRAISFAQAMALLVLARVLFGGFFRGHRRGAGWRRRMRERWNQMTPEERERLRSACGTHSGPCRGAGSRASG